MAMRAIKQWQIQVGGGERAIAPLETVWGGILSAAGVFLIGVT